MMETSECTLKCIIEIPAALDGAFILSISFGPLLNQRCCPASKIRMVSNFFSSSSISYTVVIVNHTKS